MHILPKSTDSCSNCSSIISGLKSVGAISNSSMHLARSGSSTPMRTCPNTFLAQCSETSWLDKSDHLSVAYASNTDFIEGYRRPCAPTLSEETSKCCRTALNSSSLPCSVAGGAFLANQSPNASKRVPDKMFFTYRYMDQSN